jgi:hypothetical protein
MGMGAGSAMGIAEMTRGRASLGMPSSICPVSLRPREGHRGACVAVGVSLNDLSDGVTFDETALFCTQPCA